MKKINNSLNAVKVIVLALVLTVGFQYVMAQTAPSWQAPTSAPPQGNTYAPLNVGPSGQVKDGGLTLGFTLGASSPALIIKNGTLCLQPAVGAPGPFPPEGDCRSSWPVTSGGSGSGINCSSSGCTAGFLPLFDGASTITSSVVKQVSVGGSVGNAIGIGLGASSPTERLDVNGRVRIRNTDAAAGKVLTATGSDGTATWQTVSSPIGKKAGTVNHDAVITPPAGFTLGQCVWAVSPREMGNASSNQGLDWIRASSDGSGRVTCQYSFEDGGTSGGQCYYTMICS